MPVILTVFLIIFVALTTGFAGFAVSSISSRPALRRARADLAAARWLSEHDQLTGLPNRSGAQRLHQRQAGAGHPPAAVLLDLDDFKAVNDTWGHHVGDAHLAAVAERLAHCCAAIGASASRLAGDEFLLLVSHTEPHTVLAHANDVLDQLGRPLTLSTETGGRITISTRASAGIALPEPGTGGTWADLLCRADIALYRAKAQSGHAVLHVPGMSHPSPEATSRGPRLRETRGSTLML